MNRKQLIIIFAATLLILVGWFIYIYYSRAKDIEDMNAEGATIEDLDTYQTELEAKHPLIKLLPHYQEEFELHYGVENYETMDVIYLLKIKLSSPSSEEGGDETEYFVIKDMAFEWIRENGGDPLKMPIEIESTAPPKSY